MLVTGSVFAGDYEVLRLLGQGGMGAVFEVKQRSTDKLRALKVLQPTLATDPKTRERFAQEARVGARIESEHVVEVVGAGVDAATGMPWLAMELLRGEELGALADRVGTLDPPMVAELFSQLGHALALAHATGIVHRDLKPENVFLASSRRAGVAFTVKILDFGIAKVLSEAGGDVTAAMGSPLWMAPEQLQRGGRVSPRTDVWALGLIAFRLLTGTSYWLSARDPEPSVMKVVTEVATEALEPASARARRLGAAAPPAGFDGWFARCVHRDPSGRFPDARDAVGALLLVLAAAGDGGVAARTQRVDAPRAVADSAPHAAARTLPDAPVRRSRRLWVALGGLACAGASYAAYLLLADEPPPRRRRSSTPEVPAREAPSQPANPSSSPPPPSVREVEVVVPDPPAPTAPWSHLQTSAEVESPRKEKGPSGTVQVGPPSVSGGSVTNVSSVVAGMSAGFRRCYQKALESDARLAGSVKLTLKLGSSGEVSSASSSEAGGLSGPVTSCFTARASSASFNAPVGGVATVVFSITCVPEAPPLKKPTAPPPPPAVTPRAKLDPTSI